MLYSALADILAETRGRPGGEVTEREEPGRMEVVGQPQVRLVRPTSQSQRESVLHFLSVCAQSAVLPLTVFKEVEATTSTGQVSQVLLVTFFLVTILVTGKGAGGAGEHKVGNREENRQRTPQIPED